MHTNYGCRYVHALWLPWCRLVIYCLQCFRWACLIQNAGRLHITLCTCAIQLWWCTSWINNCAFIFLCVVLHCTGWVCLTLCYRPATRWELTAEGALTQQTPWDFQRWLWKGASCLVYNITLIIMCVCVSTHSLPLSLRTQHCLAGWENAQPSVVPPQSKVDLKSAIKSTVSSVLSLKEY